MTARDRFDKSIGRQLTKPMTPSARAERIECVRQVRAMSKYLLAQARSAAKEGPVGLVLARHFRLGGEQLELTAEDLEISLTKGSTS